MSIEYIRKTYGLPVKVGTIVRIRKGANSRLGGLMGKVMRAKDAYVLVRGDTWRGYVHAVDIECEIGGGPTPAEAADKDKQ